MYRKNQGLAKISAGVAGGSSPPYCGLEAAAHQGFSFDFDFDFTAPQGGARGAAPGF
ncbi:MAG: hypothetical protein HW380_1136 [Magnetococcales bacterium]|nr:hypothetical protein [Magnetococcales bacterium]